MSWARSRLGQFVEAAGRWIGVLMAEAALVAAFIGAALLVSILVRVVD